jgi:phosphatidylglycerophosphate synthase
MSGPWSTRANALTLIRLALAPVLVWALLTQQNLLALGAFGLAVFTDLADGWVARRFGEASPLGGLFDHAVDATFVTCGSAALAWLGVLPAPLPALIAIAFLEYALDARFFESHGLRGSFLGRWNGIAYYVVVGVPVVREALSLGWPGSGLVRGLGWLLVVSTLASIADRLRQAIQTRGAG